MILIVAVVVGALAALGLYQYVGGVEDRAYANAERVEVWMVADAIPKGTSAEVALAQQLITKQLVPADVRPTTFISDPSVELSGLMAVTDLPVNAILVEGNFVAPSRAITGITNRLEEQDLVTYTLSVDEVRGVAGMLSPGDDVNIMVTQPIEAPGLPYAHSARMLYQKVRVLAIGTQLAPDLGEAGADAVEQVSGAGLVTLAVPPEAALRLAAVDAGSLYLSLVPKSYEPAPVLPIDPAEVLPGEDPRRLTPYPAGSPIAP